MPEYTTPARLAKEFNLTMAYIRSEIKEKRLTGEKLGSKNWLIVIDEKYQAWRDNPRRGEMSDVVKEAKKRKVKTAY